MIICGDDKTGCKVLLKSSNKVLSDAPFLRIDPDGSFLLLYLSFTLFVFKKNKIAKIFFSGFNIMCIN